MVIATFIVAVLPLMPMFVEQDESAARVEIKVTQKYLIPLCLNGRPVDSNQRVWWLTPGSHSLAFTMRNAPRSAVADADTVPGIAVVRFMLDADHKYEVEIRAPATTFTARVWKSGEWKPVVRDRTVDRIVSSEPDWLAERCDR
jgi:hypothetical protein